MLLCHIPLVLPAVSPGVQRFPSGYLAVDLFFLLSGFVIAFAYDRRLAGTMGVTKFVLVRLIRLAPMIWLATVIGGIVLLLHRPGSPSRVFVAVALNALVLPDVVGLRWGLFPTNGPEWSLFFEMCANVAFAVMFRRLAPAILIAIIAVAATVLAVFTLHHGDVEGGTIIGSLPLRFARVGFSFFLGVFLFRHIAPTAVMARGQSRHLQMQVP